MQVCSNSPACGTNIVVRNAWRDFRLSIPALAAVKRKSFNGKFTEKKIPIGYFMLPLLMLTSEVFCRYIHFLLSIRATCL